MIAGVVEVCRAESTTWVAARLNQTLQPGDRVRTGERSRAEIYLAGGMTIQKGELSEIEIPPTKQAVFRRGIFKIFDRNREQRFEMGGFTATAAIRGTDFLVQEGADGRFEITVLDGIVALKNAQGEVLLTNNERGVAEPGNPPQKSAVIEARNNLIQWNLYYPAVVDVESLGFSAGERQALATSLEDYRAGDLLRASATYDWKRANLSDAEAIYRAELLLSLGQVDESKKWLEQAPALPETAALLKLIKAVKFEPAPAMGTNSTAAEWLAESYYQQSLADLPAARDAARLATEMAPRFGFAWARLAELEFCFGHREAAKAALARALELSPRNAQAIALSGFLLVADDRNEAAEEAFSKAIEIDSALGNAWLGRGLTFIHTRRDEDGLRDLLVAASLEPQRSLLRSYLGKAFAMTGDDAHAAKELRLAMQLDSRDPTPWLYAALLEQSQNKINKAVDSLEQSILLNDNRAVFRSQLLLDEDQAVRSASLARIYLDAGMEQVSVDEATKAVNYDYANYSAHLFLSDSDNALRDPTQFNLRYETAWFNELLLANLYAPAGAAILPQSIAEQEYTSLFEQGGLGLFSDSQYRSDGQFRQIASQYGAEGRTSYSLDLTYQHNDGIRPNNDLSDIEWNSQIKQQISPNDAVMLFANYLNYNSGDNFQYNNPANASPNLRVEERQEPLLYAGWHHEWGPGVHTLLLVGRLPDNNQTSDEFSSVQPLSSYFLVAAPNSPGQFFYEPAIVSNFVYKDKFTIYTAELNQVLQDDKNCLVFGGRIQNGQFTTQNEINYALVSAFPAINTTLKENFNRLSTYGYYSRELLPQLLVTAGITYDHMVYPDNLRNVPITPGEARREQISPKAALIWQPRPEVTLRAAYAQALGGVTFDESFTLEPTEIAGFNQAFRSIISESLVGSLAAPRYQVLGGAADLRFKTRTYATLQAQLLTSDVDQDIGVLYVPIGNTGPQPGFPGTAPEQLRYREPSVSATLNQLVGDNWAMGAEYRYTYSSLRWFYPTFTPFGAQASLNQTETAQLNQWDTYLLFFHPSGFYARAEAQWYLQYNTGHSPSDFDPPLARSDFVQVNLLAGYRFWHRRGDISFGVLNVGGGDYSLNPLNVYNELPRSRVFVGRINLSF